MADTTTSNLLLTKPEVGASTDTWGGKINTDLDSIDAVFAAAGTGTSVGLNVGSGKTLKVAGTTDFSANLTFTGTGNRITGDFSNATLANRVAFQTSTVNGATRVGLLPNGTAVATEHLLFNAADSANASFGSVRINASDFAIQSMQSGTGSYLPLTFYTGGSERVRVDTSGNVGIGTSSPSYRLEVVSSAVNTAVFRSSDATAANNAGGGFSNISSATAGSRSAQLWLDADGANYSGGDYFYIDKLGNSGNVNLVQQSSAAMTFQTTGTERMRIDSSGNLLVGKTATAATSVGFQVGQLGELYTTKSTSTNADATYYLYSTGAAAYRFYVGMGGTIYATSTTITSLSDARLKENIRDLDDGLEKVLALKPRKFDWKEGKGQDIKDARGFVAQEFETVFPDMIDVWKDPAPEGEDPYKSVNANLIPTLVKAIQELKALVDTQASTITQLQADVAALKGTA